MAAVPNPTRLLSLSYPHKPHRVTEAISQFHSRSSWTSVGRFKGTTLGCGTVHMWLCSVHTETYAKFNVNNLCPYHELIFRSSLRTRMRTSKTHRHASTAVFFPPMPPHVLVDFVILPPGHGSILTYFWVWDAHEAQLRCPDDVSGDIGGRSARRALKPKFYQSTQTMVTAGILPFRENSHGKTGNRTRYLMISSQRLWPLDYETGLNSWNWTAPMRRQLTTNHRGA